MSVTTVAEKPNDVKSKDKEAYTTMRLYVADGEDLSDLADMEGKTIAQLYRELCAPLIRKRRIAKTEEKLRRLKAQEG
jgi:hypothetical protein